MAGGQKGRIGGAIAHGESKGRRSKEYQAWLGMRARCQRSAHYLKHGVTVCAPCQQSFDLFLTDVGRAPSPSHTLDRWPNPEGNYEPGNVRWATALEQRHNRRAGARVGRPWLGKKREVPHRADGTFAPKRSSADYMEK